MRSIFFLLLFGLCIFLLAYLGIKHEELLLKYGDIIKYIAAFLSGTVFGIIIGRLQWR